MKIKCRVWVTRRHAKSRATHTLRNQMKIMGHKKNTEKSRATHRLRNQMKIMGHKKSAVKSRQLTS